MFPKATFFAAAVLGVLFTTGCGDSPIPYTGGPVLIEIDPADHARFDQIRNAPLNERHRGMILYLVEKGHDIAWFPSDAGLVDEHDTVQVIYFGYRNYVMAFCSGVLMSGNFIGTAGHCNTAIRLSAGESCDDKVLFAYKKAKDAKIQYFHCDRLMENSHIKKEYPRAQGADAQADARKDALTRYQFEDHAVFRILDGPPKPAPNASFTLSTDWLRKSYGSLSQGNAVVGLVVDPPSGGHDLKSQYEVVLGEIVDADQVAKEKRFVRYDGTYIKAIENDVQGGNSGAPFYLIDSLPDFDSAALPKIGAGTYIAPLSGGFSGYGIINLPPTSLSLTRMFRAAFEGW